MVLSCDVKSRKWVDSRFVHCRSYIDMDFGITLQAEKRCLLEVFERVTRRDYTLGTLEAMAGLELCQATLSTNAAFF